MSSTTSKQPAVKDQNYTNDTDRKRRNRNMRSNLNIKLEKEQSDEKVTRNLFKEFQTDSAQKEEDHSQKSSVASF